MFSEACRKRLAQFDTRALRTMAKTHVLLLALAAVLAKTVYAEVYFEEKFDGAFEGTQGVRRSVAHTSPRFPRNRDRCVVAI
jgi:hypothetical protein|tara:strand:+ start:298 stop:543 length:246 start_codon:yes stop_codon:yes gene_type:complete